MLQPRGAAEVKRKLRAPWSLGLVSQRLLVDEQEAQDGADDDPHRPADVDPKERRGEVRPYPQAELARRPPPTATARTLPAAKATPTMMPALAPALIASTPLRRM